MTVYKRKKKKERRKTRSQTVIQLDPVASKISSFFLFPYVMILMFKVRKAGIDLFVFS